MPGLAKHLKTNYPVTNPWEKKGLFLSPTPILDVPCDVGDVGIDFVPLEVRLFAVDENVGENGREGYVFQKDFLNLGVDFLAFCHIGNQHAFDNPSPHDIPRNLAIDPIL